MHPLPLVGPAVRRRRWVRLAAALAGAAARFPRLPVTGARGRRRLIVCTAARLLTAAGVRVEVRTCPTGRPRSGAVPGSLVVAHSVCWVDELAVITAVPGLPVRTATVARVTGLLRNGQTVTVRSAQPTAGVGLGCFQPALLQAAVDTGAPVRPVAVRYRADGGRAGTVAAGLSGPSLLRSVRQVVATRGLVVEVHLLPELHPGGADARELAALTEYAIAAVTEVPPGVPSGGVRWDRGRAGASA